MYSNGYSYVNPAKFGFHFIEVRMRTTDSTWHVKQYHESNKALSYETIYLDDSCKIPHGDYLAYYYNGQLRVAGRYANGKRTGLWKAYNYEGRLVDSSRYKNNGTPYYKCYRWYDNGQLSEFMDMDMEGMGSGYETAYYPDGKRMHFGKYSYGMTKDSIWTYYYNNENTCLVETYDSGKLTKAICYDMAGNEKTCDTAFKSPEPIDNINSMLYTDNILPEAAQKDGIKDAVTVFLSFLIDMDGSIKRPQIIIGSHPSINEKALELIANMKPWKPTQYKGKPITLNYVLPIKFN